MVDIFFYGSLRDAALREIVLGGEAAARARPATARDVATVAVGSESYPMLIDREGGRAEGVALAEPTEAELARLFFFEGEEYVLGPLEIEAGGARVAAQVLRDAGVVAVLADSPWDFDGWTARERAGALEEAKELMALFPGPIDLDAVWPGIRRRSAARARGAASTPPQGPLNTGLGSADVSTEAVRRPWMGFIAIEEHELRHARHDGARREEVARAVSALGDAAAVLPYDPATGRILLVEQFRAGPHAAHDPRPWLLEPVAGLVDPGETPETTARREALEEAGLTIGRLAPVTVCYPSPGAASERVAIFVGEADLSDPAETGGLAAEAEDLRLVAPTLDEALAAADRGEIRAGVALTALYWLARHRDRIDADWR